MILHSKPTPFCEKSGYWYGRGRVTVGKPTKEEDKEKQEKEEFLKEEEFKV